MSAEALLRPRLAIRTRGLEGTGMFKLPESNPRKEKEQFDPSTVAIATTALYSEWQPLPQGQVRDPKDVQAVRGDLALQTYRLAAEEGYQVTVVDNPRSSVAFKQALAEIPNIHVFEENEKSTMSGGRRQTISEASKLKGVKEIVWIEPEKRDMINHAEKVIAPIREGTADIVIPKRNRELFEETYPSFQVDYETRANDRFNNLLARAGLLPRNEETKLLADPNDALDAWIGPRAIKNDPEVLRHFMQVNEFEQYNTLDTVNPELWPDALFLPIISALKDGLRVKSVEIDYQHPAEQTASEVDNPAMDQKRQTQYSTIIFSAINALKASTFEQTPDNLRQHPSQRSRLRRIV